MCIDLVPPSIRTTSRVTETAKRRTDFIVEIMSFTVIEIALWKLEWLDLVKYVFCVLRLGLGTNVLAYCNKYDALRPFCKSVL